MVERAQDAVHNQSVDNTVDKAKEMADKIEAARKAADQKFTSAPIDTSDSLLDGTDDFFSKADRFAKGDYHNTGKLDKPTTPPPPAAPEEPTAPKIDPSNDLFANTEEKMKEGDGEGEKDKDS
jgi:hypothetical protein